MFYLESKWFSHKNPDPVPALSRNKRPPGSVIRIYGSADPDPYDLWNTALQVPQFIKKMKRQHIIKILTCCKLPVPAGSFSTTSDRPSTGVVAAKVGEDSFQMSACNQ
jgi:hypothetical protein